MKKFSRAVKASIKITNDSEQPLISIREDRYYIVDEALTVYLMQREVLLRV